MINQERGARKIRRWGGGGYVKKDKKKRCDEI